MSLVLNKIDLTGDRRNDSNSYLLRMLVVGGLVSVAWGYLPWDRRPEHLDRRPVPSSALSRAPG